MDPKNQQTPPPDPQVAPAPGQKVQYVVTQQSLNGLGGWLLFFMVVFALIGIGEVGVFFSGLDAGVKTTTDTITTVFSPLLAVSLLASVTLLAMRKKLALMVVYVSIAIGALYAVISQLVVTEDKEGLGTRIGGVIVGLVLYGLLALYFRQSRRVKETLVK